MAVCPPVTSAGRHVRDPAVGSPSVNGTVMLRMPFAHVAAMERQSAIICCEMAYGQSNSPRLKMPSRINRRKIHCTTWLADSRRWNRPIFKGRKHHA